eukprot:TRINITY_DN6267_c0_g3_i1.p1 TRINITY_DN6267_c0_g3~~TRINITY_DN6267_c0_g3_i1.p1  ORF type:complete len:302 (+),score=56.69 TRINITY_DN6267_c0_g3_i1:50-907(+)
MRTEGITAPPVSRAQQKYSDEPPEPLHYRVGVNPSAKGDEKLEVGKQFWREHLSSMHTGRVYECFKAWLAEDVVWTAEGPPLAGTAKGINQICELYNAMLKTTSHGLGKLTFRVLTASYHPKLDVVRLEVVRSMQLPDKTSDVLRKRFTIKFNSEMKIVSASITPRGETSIRPVSKACLAKAKEEEEEEEEREEEEKSSEPLPLQPPTASRPCLHNNWDPVRVKNKNALLRCRVCSSQWKVLSTEIVRCRKYLSQTGCNKGSLCSSLHVNARKLTYVERTGVKTA